MHSRCVKQRQSEQTRASYCWKGWRVCRTKRGAGGEQHVPTGSLHSQNEPFLSHIMSSTAVQVSSAMQAFRASAQEWYMGQVCWQWSLR